MYVYIYIYIMIITMISIIIIIISSSSTQESSRGPVDEMHVCQKEMFSPRPEATVQVNFNAKTHLFNMKCKKTKKTKWLSPRRDAPF